MATIKDLETITFWENGNPTIGYCRWLKTYEPTDNKELIKALTIIKKRGFAGTTTIGRIYKGKRKITFKTKGAKQNEIIMNEIKSSIGLSKTLIHTVWKIGGYYQFEITY